METPRIYNIFLGMAYIIWKEITENEKEMMEIDMDKT
jgi:hypothetical protein